MIKQNNYTRELLIVALITSVFFGLFSVLPMLISSHISFTSPLRPPRPDFGLAQGPGNMGGRPPINSILVNSILVTTLMLLCLWMMNIFIYVRFRSLRIREKTKNVIRYMISYIAMFVLVSAYFLILKQVGPDSRYGRALFFPLIAGITNNTIVIIILDLVVLQRIRKQVELENAQLKMNSMAAQHQHLKHQLHPHFLFNSLNTLKSLIKRQPLEAEDYLVRLSEFLRASVTSDTQDTVALKEELKLCIDYLEMQKVRFKDALQFHIDIPNQLLNTAFVPMFSLQLLVENAIKHNAFTAEDPLHIYVTYNGDESIIVSNTKKLKQSNEPSSGIGLKNLSERYRMLADKRISIIDSEDLFSVELPILSK